MSAKTASAATTTTGTAAQADPGGDPKAKVSRTLRRGRPELYTDYASDMAMLNTPAKRVWTVLLLLGLLVLPFYLGRSLMSLFITVFVFAIGAIGLNLVSGYAGQVSLGHAFFIGLGAFTAAWVGGEGSASLLGLGLDMAIWLPVAGLVPMAVGWLVAPLASRVRGLYLAIVTLGLLFVGGHFFNEFTALTGGPNLGRSAAPPVLFGVDLGSAGTWFGFELTARQQIYFLTLTLLVVAAIIGRNIARSKVGRAFAAVRDRDIAAEVMGVPLARTKRTAFALSSFYAGICGGLISFVQGGRLDPINFAAAEGLFLSVTFLAMVLIGGPATISGSMMGAAFVVFLPRFVENVAHYLPFIGSTGLVSVAQLENILFGVFIVAFLVLEPRGLYGLWLRVRNYWKAYPFSY